MHGLNRGRLGADPGEITETDITTLQLDSSQWTVWACAWATQRTPHSGSCRRRAISRIQEDSASGRLFVLVPPSDGRMVMSLKVTLGQVTAINLVGAFAEWLREDTQLLFRAFEDRSVRHKLLGREDHRETVRGGTSEAPTVDVTYAYFKEGVPPALCCQALGRRKTA